ncbi:substrate-binding domain-containing protein [Actinoplanes missouriensis]|uniref:molybdate ABC transporter substrate-binding protein n=1 Tax=Actinoplanes missouriensis TaxID=1866 RepID=UPI0033F8F469
MKSTRLLTFLATLALATLALATLALATLALSTLALAGCATTPTGDGPTSRNADESTTNSNPATSLAPEALGQIRVLASTSLTEAFDTIREDFQARNPQVEVLMTYAGSGSLTRQAAGGEPVDVIATDDPRTLSDVAVLGKPETFAGGRLSVAVLEKSADPTNAALFVDYLREGAAQRILTDTGVLRP